MAFVTSNTTTKF